ncbi:Ig-like domain-containing protein [Sulfurovum sp. XGS-02]|uniref:DUF7507 domain-containing protein n=1 Tax=Sulfurovum sp. XGS-02 TaxID=2925411 RepID=UPI00204AB229|nr:Ig-like domain-containing protein [Sulfurovum sp. XGS-02]UPT77791.1 Ig-like domain-containing protein [Sulfurovum sp. XGS-02]
MSLSADPFPPHVDSNITGAHYAPVSWPAENEWKPYSRFGNDINDARTQDPSNGGTAPQNYVNVASSCVDTAQPSVYYFLRQGATPEEDVIMFRWRVEQIANTYATGPNTGAYSSGDAWNSALWTVLFDIDGDGIRDVAAHLDGSSGSPSEPIDMIFGIYGDIPTQSIDYTADPNIQLIGHNPTAFVGTDDKILNFHNGTAVADVNWPNGSDETVWDYGTTRSSVSVSSPCTEYYIDYQIPVALIDASRFGGPKLTRESPISMIFCTANSLNNPFQKDCAINAEWIADPNKEAPFGDYISFNKEEPYEQPIVDDIGASGCNPTVLTAKVKDVIAIVDGEAVPSVSDVIFFYYRDDNGDGVANDGNEWTQILAPAIRTSFTDWMVNWNSTELFKGQYLIGVQTIDDPTLVDNDMNTSAKVNRTFSYLSEAEVNASILAAGAAYTDGNEIWYANPDITGVKSISLAVNTCGVAPTIEKYASVENILAGEDINFTIDINNSTGFNLEVSQISDVLPNGFSYKSLVSLEYDGVPIAMSASPIVGEQGTISWHFNETILDGSQIKLIFTAQSTITSGSYTNTAYAQTSYGTLLSDPVPIQVDGARISLSKTPSSYFVTPGESLVYTLDYANDSSIVVTGAELNDTLPADASCNTYSINGGANIDCSGMGSIISIPLGTLEAFESGSVEMNVTVDASYSTTSLLNTAILTVTAPDGSDVNKTAESKIGVDIPVAAFTLEKTSDVDFVALNNNVEYTLTYTNYGDADALGVTLTDTLPVGMTYISSVPSATDNGDGTYTWDLGSVTAGTTASVTITTEATEDALVTGVFTGENPARNEAVLSWSGPAGGGSVDAHKNVGIDSETCQAFYYTDITGDVGSAGNQLLAQSSITNAPTEHNVTFSANNSTEHVGKYYMDPAASNTIDSTDYTRFEILLNYTSSVVANVDFTVAVYDYNPADGTTTLIESGLTAGSNGNSNKTILMSVTNPYNIPSGHRILWDINATSSKVTTLSFNVNNRQNRSLLCKTAPAAMSIAKTVDHANVSAGVNTPVTYTIDYANISGTDVTNAVITDILPPNVTITGSTPAITSQVGQEATFNIGTVLAGSSGQIIINATINAAASGTLTNFVIVSSDNAEDVNDTAQTSVGPLSTMSPSLTISKRVDKTYVSAGETLTYILKVVNTGGEATGITITDTIPQQIYFDYVVGSITGSTDGPGTVVASDSNSPDLSWTISSLAQGEVATLTYKMRTSASGIPVGVTILDNTAIVSDSEYCTAASVSGCTSNTVSVTVSGNPVLNISISPDAPTKIPGETITYTVDYNNTGSADANNTKIVIPAPNYTVIDPASLPAGVSFDGTNNQIIYDLDTLASGSSGTFTFNAMIAQIMPSGTTEILATATISASNAQSDLDTTVVTVNSGIDLTVDISGPSSGTYPIATIEQNAVASTTITINDVSEFSVGDVIKIGGLYTEILAIIGSTIELTDAVTVNVGDSIIGSVIYNVVYRNHGDSDAIDVNLTVTIPTGMEHYTSEVPADLSPAKGDSGSVIWNIGTVVPDQSDSYQITVFPSMTGSYTFTTNIVSTDIVDNVENNNSDEITTVFGGLKITKSTSTPLVLQPASGNEDVNYTITITNTLAIDISDVNVTDTLPPGFIYNTTTSSIGIIDATYPSQPRWTGITVPANGTVTIEFTAQIDNTVGAATYQNAVYAITGEANVSVTQYDELSSTAEDVTVIDGADGLIEGYIFEDKNSNGIFDTGDIPYVNVEVTITDESNSLFFYTVMTDGSGYFSKVVAAGNWTIQHDTTNIVLSLLTGYSNPTSVVVTAGGTVLDLNPYVDFTAMPSISLIKTVASISGTGTIGDTITYNFEVNNTGNVDLTNITITDVNATVSGGPIDLAAGTGDNTTFTATHSITAADIAAGQVTNQALVTGTPPSGPDVNDTSDDNSPTEDDPTVVDTTNGLDTSNPSISVEKIGTFIDENNNGYAEVGETISYEFNVTNTGNVTLYDVNLTDDNAVITGGPIASLAPGQSDTVTFTGVHTVTWQDIIDGKVINQAIVMAEDSHGNDLNDTSDDPQNPVNDDLDNDGEPDDETSTGLPIQPPISTDDTYNAATGESVIIDIVNNDSSGTFALDSATVTLTSPSGATNIITDTDGDTVGFTVPGEGTWSVDETTGEVTFIPEDGYVGDPTPIEYTIEDEQGNETTSEISINYPPVANNDNVTAELNEVITLEVLANDQNTSDPFDPTTVRLIDSNGNETDILYVPNEGTWIVETNGSVTFEPDFNFSGEANINYVVRETNGDVSNEATITIYYPSTIDAIDDGVIKITHYGPTPIYILDNDSYDGDVTIKIIEQPAHGSVEIVEDVDGRQRILYTPEPDYNYAPDTFRYSITDANGNVAEATVRLDIQCASSQSSDSGDALGTVSMLVLAMMTLMTGLYFVRREEERGEA